MWPAPSVWHTAAQDLPIVAGSRAALASTASLEPSGDCSYRNIPLLARTATSHLLMKFAIRQKLSSQEPFPHSLSGGLAALAGGGWFLAVLLSPGVGGRTRITQTAARACCPRPVSPAGPAWQGVPE